MRILVCNWRDLRHPRAGGAEVYTHEIARRWVAAGHAVTLCCAAVDGAPAFEDIDGVSVVRRGGPLSVYRAAREYYRRTGSGRFDLVIDEVNTRPFGCPRWAGATPVVALIHQVCREIWHAELPPPVALAGRYLLEPAWLRGYRTVRTLTVSASSQESLRRYGLRDVTVVPAGVTRRPRPDVPREPRPTVIFVGRLTANKRPLAALAAFHQLRTQMPAAQMWFVGDGPQRAALAAHAGPGVTLFGRVSRAERDDLLARAHVLVVTSVREGWGLVVDEAAAMGTPTVGYDRPGLRDSIPPAGGVLVEPAPAALAAALRHGLPRWTATPAVSGWRGGAADWATVADTVLAEATTHSRLPHDEEVR